MTQEEKQLLLKDLCARLRCGVIVKAQYKDGEGWKTEDRKLKGIYDDGQVYIDCIYTNIENVKPYLRSMSSMTKEEKEEYDDLVMSVNDGCENTDYMPYNCMKYVDWLNEHQFDYRGLIPIGLALEAPEDMYKSMK